MYINEEYGASKIAKILNEENIKTKRGCKWTQNGICRILTNRMYCGIIINGKEEVKDFLTGDRIYKPEEEWKVVERPDLAIIDKNTFELAQRKMEKNKEKISQGQRKDCKHVFSTLLKCTDCGHFFRQANEWQKIEIYVDGTNMDIYINGVLKGKKCAPLSMTSVRMWLGSSSAESEPNLYIDRIDYLRGNRNIEQ